MIDVSDSTDSARDSDDLSELPAVDRLEEEKKHSDFVAFSEEEIDQLRSKGEFLDYDEQM